MKKILLALGVVTLLYFVATQIVPPYIGEQRNPVKSPAPYAVSAEAQDLYDDLDFIADLHCDALLWGRDLTERGEIGHVDFPRMREASVGLEMFTIVSKSPAGQNMESNSADAFDNITPLTIAKGEYPTNWFSLFNRTLSQSENLADFVEEENGRAIFIKSRSDLEKLIIARNFDKSVIGALLGIEGAHALEGNIDNLDLVYAAGVRMIGPTHFFDNDLGGSAHGENLGGLTDFGKEAIQKMNALGIFIDLAHCSPAVVEDVLNMSTTPVIVSHTGVQGVFDSQRNLSDDQIKKIAGKDGIIGIAFFDMAVGEPELPNIIASIRHIRDLVGIQYVALGSDYDGSLAVPFDITGLPLIVEGLMEDGSTTQEIRAVMGENIKEFILKNLRYMKESLIHQENSFFGKLQEYLREFVYGGIDGAVTTFAVVAGGFGANLDTGIIIILGFANLFADGFSMSIGAYLAAKTEKDNYKRHQDIEYWEVENLPDVERDEIREIYEAKGFKGELLEKVVDQICSDKDIWVAEMMKDELNMMEETKSPFRIGLATLISFIVVGFIPLTVYLWDFFSNVQLNIFLWTSILTGIAFMLVGWMKSLVNQTPPFKSIAETLLLGLLAALVAYYVGDILAQFFIGN